MLNYFYDPVKKGVQKASKMSPSDCRESGPKNYDSGKMSDFIGKVKPNGKIFSDVKYFITGHLQDEVKKILDEGGAEKINFFSDMVTHCLVGDQPSDNDISDAKDLYEVPAVTPYWVLFSAFCNKILPTRGFAYDTKQIFSEVTATTSQIVNGDFKAIWAMITFYGGTFKSNLDSRCTHLICGKPTGSKYNEALKHGKIKIVTPDWVVECIKSCSCVNEDSFHPKYLVFPKAREPSPHPPSDLSTAQILGFADDVVPAKSLPEGQPSPSSTQALLEELKQRMPWNRPATTASTTSASATVTQMPFSQSTYSAVSHNKIITQQQAPHQLQTHVVTSLALTNTTLVVPQTVTQTNSQGERQSAEQQNRMPQQGPLWRPAAGQTVRPQYTLIQRVGSVVQTPSGNWQQYHIQQQHQRLQTSATGQNQISLPQAPQSAPQAQQQGSAQQQQTNQQVQHQPTILQNSQIQVQQPGPGPTAIQVQTGHIGQRQITWTQQPQLQGPPKQVIQLDPETHAQLSHMDPHQRALFLQKIQRQRQIILQQRQLQLHQQRQQQQRQLGQVITQQPAPQTMQQQAQGQQGQQQAAQPPQPMALRQQIIIRSVMPPGLNPQQQAAWLHQQQFIRQQQILVQQQSGGQVRQQVSGAQQRVIQQQTATATWIPQQAENQSQQQQQQQQPPPPTQQQMHLQRQQQLRIQQMQIQKQQPIVVQRSTPGAVQQQFQQVTNQPGLVTQALSQPMHAEDSAPDNAPGVGGGLLMNNRTKTALANMLSSRLQTGHLSPQSQVVGQADGSAAGQLRMMSAQQRAPQPPPPPSANQLPTEPQQVLYNQQRRTLGNITNAGSNVRPLVATREVGPPGTPTPVPKSPSRAALAAPAAASSVSVPPKPQFFAHNPGIRIPPDKYLIGCVFYIVEYDRSEEQNLSSWEEIIRDHGGEVETNYNHRVTHVLCETQKHGIVQQALRDGKRCITAFWLNDIVLRGALNVPWLALHFPVPFGRDKPLSKYHMTLSGFEDKAERERVATMIKIAGGQYRNYLSPLTHILVCRKAEGAKYKKAKDTNKVVVNVQWLNEVLFGHYVCIQQPDVHKYQQFNLSNCFRVDYTLIPHLMGAWKLPINVSSEVYNSAKNSPPSLRRTKKPRLDPNLEELREIESKILESVQVTNLENLSRENRPYVMITGDKNFEIAKKAKQMGCIMDRNSVKVTHLIVCGKPVRTLKFLKCLILCKYVVRDSWIIESCHQNKLLSEIPYLIHNIDSEDFKCNVSKVLSIPNRTNLLKDKIFYMTPGIVPGRSALGELITLSGGQIEKQRRSVKAIQELNKTSPVYFVITCYNDLALIADIFRAKLDFYTTEFVMKAILTQTLDYTTSAYRY